MATLTVPGDYATIQLAVNAASSGDIIDLVSASYTENVQILSKTNITIQGDGGKDKSTIWEGSGGAHTLRITNSSFITLNGIQILGPAAANFDGVRVLNSSDTVIDDCWFYGRGGSGVRAGITAEVTTSGNRITISNSILGTAYGDASGQNYGLLLEGPVDAAVLQHSTIYRCNTGVFANRAGPGGPGAPRVVNCSFRDCSTNAILYDDVEDVGAVESKVEGCTIDLCGNGIRVTGTISTDSITIQNTNVTNCTGTGINNASTGITVNSNNCNVFGNGTDYGGTVGQTNNISSDPLYATPGSIEAADYRLQTGSPSRNAGDADVSTWDYYVAGYVYSINNVVDVGTIDIGIHTLASEIAAGTIPTPPWLDQYLLQYHSNSLEHDGDFSVASYWGVTLGDYLIPVIGAPVLDPGYVQVTNRRAMGLSSVEKGAITFQKQRPTTTWTFHATYKNLAAILRLFFQSGVSEDASSPYKKIYTPYTSKDVVSWGVVGRYNSALVDPEVNHFFSGAVVSQIILTMKEDAPVTMQVTFVGRKFTHQDDTSPIADIPDDTPLMWQDANFEYNDTQINVGKATVTLKNNVRSRWWHDDKCWRHDLGSVEGTISYEDPLHVEPGQGLASIYSKVETPDLQNYRIYWGTGSGSAEGDVAILVNSMINRVRRAPIGGELVEVVTGSINSDDSGSLDGIRVEVTDGIDRGF